MFFNQAGQQQLQQRSPTSLDWMPTPRLASPVAGDETLRGTADDMIRAREVWDKDDKGYTHVTSSHLTIYESYHLGETTLRLNEAFSMNMNKGGGTSEAPMIIGPCGTPRVQEPHD